MNKMVYLIGAGPGDYGLITYKGMEILRKCDVVIYDRLGTNELLEEVPKSCQRIYVGKKAGAHYRKQEEINKILVETAKKHKVVVRLKGGDPFVFGRGGEEVLALEENKIPFKIIPGITSSIAVPELLGIPVTHRGVSRSFHVFTGHTKAGENSLEHIENVEGTSVFLMGLAHLEEIVKVLVEKGAEINTPVAVIASGALPREKIVKGTLKNIVEKTKANNIESPAIIVVGETADYNFKSDNLGPLGNKKIGVVGTKELREKIRNEIEAKGGKTYAICNMEIKETKEIKELEDQLNNIEKYSWVGFTSQNTIRIFFKCVRKNGIDLRRFSNVKFAVVGSGTYEALEKEGFKADYIPKEYTTEAMAKGLVSVMNNGEKVLLPRAVNGSVEMNRILKENNVDTTIVPIYNVVGNKTDNWKYMMDFDVITFASKSGVDAFVSMLEEEPKAWNESRKANNVSIAVIGRITKKALNDYGIEADIVPKQCDVAHMISETESFFGEN